MDRKKIGSIFFFGLIVFSMFSFVSAATGTSGVFDPIFEIVQDIFVGAFNVLKAPLSILLGSPSTDMTASADVTANMFLAKILLTLLLFAILSSVLKFSGIDFLKEGFSHWIVTSIVAILSVRFLNEQFINTILLPYSTIGVAMTAAIPFIFYFFFIEKGFGSKVSPIVRKTAWIFFALIFFAMWVMRKDELLNQGSSEIVYVIYPFTAFLAVVFAFLDGTIQKIFLKWELSRSAANAYGSTSVYYSDLLNECHNEWKKALRADPTGSSYTARFVSIGRAKGKAAYTADVKALQKQLSSLTP